MFCINDSIMYGNTGVCKIIDIRREKFDNEEILYYILKPVYRENDATIYCPVGNDKVRLRKLLSAEEITELIQSMSHTEPEWIDNDHLRRQTFNEILKGGNHQELVQLIKTLDNHRENKIKEGKKFHLSDEKIMKQAEAVLYEEFAYVLNIMPDEVVPFIVDELEKSAKSKRHYEN